MGTVREAQRRARSTGRLTIGRAVLAESERPGIWRFKPEVLRVREIERVLESRHGPTLPETDDACLYLEAVHMAALDQDMAAWAKRWAPWMEALPELPAVGRRMQSADACARLLNITLAERTALGLKTIGACDVSKAQRLAIAKEIKRKRDRERQERNRNKAGAVSRKSYESGSAETTKPWELAGMGRSKWYALGLNKARTGPSPILIVDTTRDGLVHEGSASLAQQGHGGRGGPVAPRIFLAEDDADAA